MSDYRIEVTRGDGRVVEPLVVELDDQMFFSAVGGSVQAVMLGIDDERVAAVCLEFNVAVGDGEHMAVGFVTTIEGADFFAQSIVDATAETRRLFNVDARVDADVLQFPVPPDQPA